MPPVNFRFGGGAADSLLNPLVAVWLLIAIIWIFAVPRAKSITPFLLAFFTIPIGQVILIGGFHFTALRILILAGLVRRAFFPGGRRNGKFPGGINGIDWVVILWAVSAFICDWLEFRQLPALINVCGTLIDTLGGYLVVRSFVVDGEGVKRTVKTLAMICTIQGVCMIIEQITRVNVFGLLGGMYDFVVVRDGRMRSSGIFGYLWAGAFGAVLMPMFLWLWNEKKSRLIAACGLVGATAMVITSNSSTSLLAFAGACLGLAFWPLRKQMRTIRLGLVVMLTGLHLVMKAPVWALIARIDLTGSSSSNQRYMLVDMTIRRFGQWWLVGTPDYVNWGWDSWDLCNQFVAVALTGGLLALIFYIMIFSRSFSAVGKARHLISGDRRKEWMLWCFGSSLFANVVAHFGINYMAQLIMGFFPLIACISVVTYETRRAAAASKAEKTAPLPPPVPIAIHQQPKVLLWATRQRAL